MRILRVAQTCYPDVTGGGAYHVHAMSRDQAAMGHDVTVLTVRQEPDQPHLEERDGYTVVRYDPTVSALGNVLSMGLASYLRRATSRRQASDGGRRRSRGPGSGEDRFDVIHAHSHLYASTNLAALCRRLGGPPLAVTNHGLYSQTAPEWVFDRYLRTVGRWTFEQADLVFCYTDVDEHRLRELGVTSDVAVVPNGVDTERFHPDGPESDELADDAPTVLFVGRLVEGKRPQDAVAAMEQVREAIPDARLALCGDGPLREELERRVSEEAPELTDAVRFLGHVEYDEMPAIYRAADALVLPSRAEGMPRTVLEARASGIPVVTTDLEHVAAGTDPDVRTVPVEDVDAIAAAIVAALADDVDDLDGADAPDDPTDRAGADAAAAVAGRVEALQGDGGRSVAVESDRPWPSTDREAAGVASMAATTGANASEGPSRQGALDWRSTVRETTSALERLVATTDTNR